MESTHDVTTTTLSLSKLFPDWSYLISAPFSSSQGITAVFLVTLSITFIGASGVFLFHLWKARRRITFLFEQLKGIQSDALIQNREQIKANMRDDKDCGALWNEFDESLVASNSSENRRLYNTIDASHFFDTHTLARGMTESRLMASIPGVLTAIGVLGTFLGLTLGLGGLGEIGGGSTKHLEEGISGMIHAASIAFTTSFWGVLSSVIFNFGEKLFESDIRKKITSLQDRIDYLFPRLTPEQMLMDISSHAKSSDETMLGLAEKIGSKMQESVSQMQHGITEGLSTALQDVLEPALTALAESARKATEEQTHSSEIAIKALIDHFMNQFGKAGAEQGQMMRDAAGSLKVFIEEMKKEHTESIRTSTALDAKRQKLLTYTIQKISDHMESFKEAVDTNREATSFVVKQQVEVVQSLNKVCNDLLTFSSVIKNISSQLAESVHGLSKENEKLNEASQFMAGAVSDAAQSNELVSQSNQKTSQELQILLDKIESSRVSAEEIANQLRASAEAGKDTFEELKSHQEGYRDALNNHVKELNTQLSGVLEHYATEVREQIHDRMNTWDQESRSYTTAMQGVVHSMAELVNERDERRNR